MEMGHILLSDVLNRKGIQLWVEMIPSVTERLKLCDLVGQVDRFRACARFSKAYREDVRATYLAEVQDRYSA